MAHTYDGVDPPGSPIIPTSPTANKGVWPTAQLTDDADERDAASAMQGIEAAHDKGNFLAWRMINIIEGGTYGFTSAISLSNAMTLKNGLSLSTAGVFSCSRPASFTGTTSFGGAVSFNGSAPLLRSPGAYALRPTLPLPASTGVVAAPWRYDCLHIPDPPTNTGFTYTLAEPSAPFDEDVWLLVSRFVAGGNANAIKTASIPGGALVTFHENQTSEASVLFCIPAGQTAWGVKHYNGLKRSKFLPTWLALGEQNWDFY